MKILKESKEELPMSFLTNLVSRCWDQVGILQEEIAAIKKTFANTDKIEKIMQDLVDAYLVCLGQAELYLQDKDLIAMPEIKESINEAINIKITEVPDDEADISVAAAEPDTEIVNDPAIDAIKDNFKPPITAEVNEEPIESWTCDFEDPVITDEDRRNISASMDSIR